MLGFVLHLMNGVVFKPIDYVVVQTNLQPLHFAATAGQLEIIKLLVETYKVPADAAAMVKYLCRRCDYFRDLAFKITFNYYF